MAWLSFLPDLYSLKCFLQVQRPINESSQRSARLRLQASLGASEAKLGSGKARFGQGSQFT